jgi:hypothetical protein
MIVPYWDMPRSVAQITGMLVTIIVTFGTDLDAVYSVPLGIFAGALALFFVSMSEARDNFRRLAAAVLPDRRDRRPGGRR